MAPTPESSALSLDYHGPARLFPLPNLVMFPHVIQPLRIFEPRYRQMLEDTMQSDRLICMSLLKTDDDGRGIGDPPIEDVACAGRVLTQTRDDEGCYQILLQGVGRVRVLRERPTDRLYRTADVEVLPDDYPQQLAEERPLLRQRVLQCFQLLLPKTAGDKEGELHQQLNKLLGDTVPLGVICDIIAHSVSMDPSWKQALLAEANVNMRAALLCDFLDLWGKPSVDPPDRPFPPEFSLN